MKTIWITGYRQYELGIFKDDDPKLKVIKYALRKLMIEQIETGVTWILTGGQLGTEQWCAEIALDLKPDYPEIKIGILLPFKNFGGQWKENNRMKLGNLLEQVDFVGYVSEQEYQSPRQLQNYQQFMYEHTGGALMLYDPQFPSKSEYDYQFIKNHEDSSYNFYPFDMDWLQNQAEDYAQSHLQE